MHTWQFYGFQEEINVNIGTEVIQANSRQQFIGEKSNVTLWASWSDEER